MFDVVGDEDDSKARGCFLDFIPGPFSDVYFNYGLDDAIKIVSTQTTGILEVCFVTSPLRCHPILPIIHADEIERLEFIDV